MRTGAERHILLTQTGQFGQTAARVCTASKRKAWSRSPIHVWRDGAASNASISGRTRKSMRGRVWRLRGMDNTR